MLTTTSSYAFQDEEKNVYKLNEDEREELNKESDSHRVNVLKNLYLDTSRSGQMKFDTAYMVEKPMTMHQVANLSHPYLRHLLSQQTERELEDIERSIESDDSREHRKQAIFNTALKYGMEAGLYYTGRTVFNAYKDDLYYAMSETYPYHALMLDNGKVKPPVIEKVGFSSEIENRRTIREKKARYRIVEQSEVTNGTPSFLDHFQNLLLPPPSDPNLFLLPIDEYEMRQWRKGALNGWVQGVKMARQIITANIRKNHRTFHGYLTYHALADANIVTRPDSQNTLVGTTSRGDILNIGESVFEITRLPQLTDDSQNWLALPPVDDIFGELTADEVNRLSREIEDLTDIMNESKNKDDF
jgi:hypothetical protein